MKSVAEKFVHNCTKDTEGETVNWLQIKWLQYIKGSTEIYFKYKMIEEEFQEIDITNGIMDPRMCKVGAPNINQGHNTKNMLSVLCGTTVCPGTV
jgi:hypothetical protein